MKLYDVPNNTWVRIPECNEIVFFDHLDGAYSYCLDKEGNVCHLSCAADVEIVESPLTES